MSTQGTGRVHNGQYSGITWTQDLLTTENSGGIQQILADTMGSFYDATTGTIGNVALDQMDAYYEALSKLPAAFEKAGLAGVPFYDYIKKELNALGPAYEDFTKKQDAALDSFIEDFDRSDFSERVGRETETATAYLQQRGEILSRLQSTYEDADAEAILRYSKTTGQVERLYQKWIQTLEEQGIQEKAAQDISLQN